MKIIIEGLISCSGRRSAMVRIARLSLEDHGSMLVKLLILSFYFPQIKIWILIV
jgi:hypothetical protein